MSSSPDHPGFHPSQITLPPISTVLLQLIYGLVIPLFAGGNTPDLNAARQAAIELIQSYRPRTQPELFLIAKIVSFGLAALDNLRISMGSDHSVSVKLRLRGNAVALERLVGRNTDTLDRTRSAQPLPDAPLDPWTAADEVDLKGMLDNARVMIETANAELAAAYADAAEPAAPAAEPAAAPAPQPIEQLVGPQRPEPAPRPAASDKTGNAANPDLALPGAATANQPWPVNPTQELAAGTPDIAIAGSAPIIHHDPAGHENAPAAREPLPPAAAAIAHGSAPKASSRPAVVASMTQDQQAKLLWADAMTVVAQEYANPPANIPATQRRLDAIRATTLSTVANELIAIAKAAQAGTGDSPRR